MEKQTKIWARNEFGTKPLYYVKKDGQIHTNSSITPLLQYLDKREVNQYALNHYLAFRCTPEDQTMFEEIKKVPPGCSLVNGEIKRYWDIKYEEKNNGEELLKHMEEAVQKHMDKEQGIFLSGGMDSSTILALCCKAGKQNTRTYSAGFNVEGCDERKEARQTAEYFKANHKEIELTENSFKVWPRLVSIFEEPMADPTKIPVYFLCKKARKKCKSILVGEGGDENFASYSQYRFMRKHSLMQHIPAWLLRKTPKSILNKFFKYVAELGEEGIERFNRFTNANIPGDRYQEIVSVFSNIEREHLLKQGAVSMTPQNVNNVNEMVKTDIRAIMSEDLMMKMYKNASYFGLGGRFPFLNKDLFEYTSSMNMKIRLKGKEIMKKAMKGILPDFVLNRKKSRFFVPIHKWGIKGVFEKIITKEQTKDYFNWEHIQKMIKGYDKSPLFYARQMFALIDFIIWKRIFIDKESYKKVQEEI